MIACPLCHHEKLCDSGGVIETDNHVTHKRYIVCSDCLKAIQDAIDEMEKGEK